MPTPVTTARSARALAGLAAVAALAVAALLARGHARPEAPPPGSAVALAVPVGYPGPTPGAPPAPSATPAPAGGLYPPPGVPHAVVALDDLAVAPVLRELGDALAARDIGALTARLAGEPIALEPLGASEGSGARVDPAQLGALLETLLPAEGAAVIQGFFGADCVPRGETCALAVVITGLEGTAAYPTRVPDEPLGREPPAAVPVGAAVWELVPVGVSDAWWRAWYVADGYHAALEAMAVRHGTYYVIR